MTIRFIPVLALAFATTAGAALAQNNGTMSAPAGAMSNHMADQNNQGCTPAQNHMASGGDHMSGGAMSGGNHMAAGEHMAGGTMANGSMSGDHMSANHMANTNCQTDQTTPPKH